MSTSEYDGRLLTGLTFPATSPVDASFCRDVITNNLNHYADEHAQVRCAFAVGSTSFTGGQGYLAPVTISTVDQWYWVASGPTFPIPMRADGSSYRLRIRLAFGCSSAAGTVTFKVILGPESIASGYDFPEDDCSFEASTTATTVAWRTGASLGSANATQIYVPRDLAAAWMSSATTLADVAGEPAAVPQLLVGLHVFAKTSHATSQPRLYGLYAAEWVGAPGVGD